MRRNSFFTTISLILVIILLVFAIYSLLYPLSKTRSRISFIFADTNLYLQIDAWAGWLDEGEENRDFNAYTSEGRLNKDVWNVPDIIFSAKDGGAREAEIIIEIYNHNPEKQVKIEIYNVAFDSEPEYLTNPRFITNVICKDGATGLGPVTSIVETDQKIEPPIILASPDEDNPNFLVLTFRYNLVRENVDFDFSQNIRINFETV